ncbi:hypothetical protein CSB45_00115 [candidate division KSB3 bacterium]|uniref:PLAT domain-containing protein n=1 Tax=candidate division KSB3 bacterium TaxID=2044937 RepID=A0A2G6EFR7_9BACT|nr:MAG: hypothetical protein CSB45_00115 [candidate division KSB3 bacterium]PIE31123.1 MAG: hypothetical protein CSA57_00200 [candidate division KSB3 bacterium]
MKKHIVTQCLLSLMLLSLSLFMISCGDDDDDGDPREGLIDNQTPYNIRVNFMGAKISEVPAQEIVRENALERGTTYQVQVTLVDATGAAVTILPIHSLYIDRSADDNRLNNTTTCSWYLSVVGDTAPFSLTSGS